MAGISSDTRIKKHIAEFLRLRRKVRSLPKPGTYQIEVADILIVGIPDFGEPATVIIRDTTGVVWEIPEDYGDFLEGRTRLQMRYALHSGNRLEVVVARRWLIKKISRVFVL